MPEKSKKTKPLRNSNLFLILISAIIAFALWIVMSLTAFPEMTQVIRNVPIDFSLAGSYADVAGISILDTSNQTVNLRITGQRYLIGDYTSDDVHVGINLDSVRAPGVYELALVVTSNNGDEIEVEQIEPSTVRVEFDYIITKEFSVADGTLAADISSLSASQGYLIDPSEVTINPSTVELRGPRDYINQITSCVVKVDSSSTLKTTLTTDNTSLVMYNGENVVEDEKITAQTDSFELTVPVYMRKDLNLDVVIQTYFDQFDISSLKYTIDPSTIAVRSQSDRITDLDEISLGFIDLRNIDVNRTTFQMPINDTEYYTNITGLDTATVTFDLENYSMKTVSLSNSQVYPINVPSGYTVNVESETIQNVTIVGPSDVIDQIDSSDVIAQLDMLDYNVTEGYNIYPVSVYLPTHNDCWCVGYYQVYCSLERTDAQTVNPTAE